MMSDIAHAAGYLAGAFGIAFAVAFGLWAGFIAGTWTFGALNIKFKHGDMNVNVRSGPQKESS